ncbi:MAG: PQQ-binding-like beta-propeller repeat protein, partial [Gammaproteobacteria bacterium]|nr:PQQ-binding-like beta-propeller repeat protein [Gammaproteobacteria bacterium]
DELVISGFDSGKLVAFNRENGSTVWEHTVTSPRGRTEIERLVDLDGQFILLDNIIYISSFQGDLVALTLNSGQVLWSRKFSSFQAMDADNEALYLTDDKSHIWSIDRRTGSAFWKQDVFNARKLTAPRLLGDKIVVADLEGYIHWLSKADGSLLTRIQPFDIRYISQPLAIDSSIVVIDVSGQLTVLTQDKTLESPSYSNIRFNR